MTTLAEIQADRHKWKKITGTGTAPYNPARYELKEKYKKEQRKQLKKTTTPTTTKRVDKPTTTTKTDTRSNLEKLRARATEARPRYDLEKAVRAGAEKEKGRATRKKEVKETPFGLRTVKGRAMLSDAAKEQLAKTKTARQKRIKEDAIREAARKRETAPVKIKALKPLLDDLLVEKTGGKVSRRKGGTVSRRGGGPIEHDGNLAVSDGYDKIKT